jgi:hypothetical protein
LLAGTRAEVLPSQYYRHSTGIVPEKEEKLADTQGLKCGRWPEVLASWYYRPSTGVVPAPLKNLAVYSILKSGSWLEVGRRFRLAGTTALVPVGRYYRPCSGPVLDMVLLLSVCKPRRSRRWPVAKQKFRLGLGRYYHPRSEEVPVLTSSTIMVGNRGHLFKGGFFSIELTSTRFSLLHYCKSFNSIDLFL